MSRTSLSACRCAAYLVTSTARTTIRVRLVPTKVHCTCKPVTTTGETN